MASPSPTSAPSTTSHGSNMRTSCGSSRMIVGHCINSNKRQQQRLRTIKSDNRNGTTTCIHSHTQLNQQTTVSTIGLINLYILIGQFLNLLWCETTVLGDDASDQLGWDNIESRIPNVNAFSGNSPLANMRDLAMGALLNDYFIT